MTQYFHEAGPYQVGTHQLNFCKSADDISASLKTLMEKYEKEVQALVDAGVSKVRWGCGPRHARLL